MIGLKGAVEWKSVFMQAYMNNKSSVDGNDIS